MGGSIASTMGRWFDLDGIRHAHIANGRDFSGFWRCFWHSDNRNCFCHGSSCFLLWDMNYDALIPCLIGAIMGAGMCVAWGNSSYHYSISSGFSRYAVLRSFLDAGSQDGPCSLSFWPYKRAFFAEMTHGIGNLFKKTVKQPYLRPVAGGVLVIAMVYMLGTTDYLGLGVIPASPDSVTISSCFSPDGAGIFSWWWKLLFTAVTLGSDSRVGSDPAFS